MESILTSIKKSLGIGAEYTHFDDILVFHINSVFSILTQLGVGPSKGIFNQRQQQRHGTIISPTARHFSLSRLT